jgi:transcriptional regulator GlxA family with amidase domain
MRPVTTSPVAGPLARRPQGCEAVLVDAGPVVTGGGVTLATDTTLHLLARLYSADVMAEVARAIEYDRALAANRAALGVMEPALP